MKMYLYGVASLAFVTLLFVHLVENGIPFIHCTEDNWGEEYTETVTREWHEIGGNDPRYEDPCGPGCHAGSLGAPGCHQLD